MLESGINSNVHCPITIEMTSRTNTISPSAPRAGTVVLLLRSCGTSSLDLGLLCSSFHWLFDLAFAGWCELVLGRYLACGCVPVDEHLNCEYDVEGETCKEAVEDDLVGNFLEGCEDARHGAEEVGEDLEGELVGVSH